MVMPCAPRPCSLSLNARSITPTSSTTVSARSTYTRARESNALFNSTEGSSVVAPMKVSVPSSTKGRKASCCALLKRCTSSTNRIVARPDCTRTCLASSTAARTSFTPASTAEMLKNCACTRRAMSRASVVLPVPGGPHRIIEWMRPCSIASRSGLPGPRRWVWPAYSSRSRGRMRSASGWPLVSSLAKRSAFKTRLFAHHVHAGRGLEIELRRHQFGIALQVGELQARGLAEVVFEFHRAQVALIEAEPHLFEAAVFLLGRELHPLEFARLAFLGDIEVLLKRLARAQQLRGRVAHGLVESLDRDLLELDVVNPHLVAVGDDQLVVRRFVIPAEFAGSLQRERALCLFADLHARVEHGLGEFTAQRLHLFVKGVETLATARVRNGRRAQQQRAALIEVMLTPGTHGMDIHDFTQSELDERDRSSASGLFDASIKGAQWIHSSLAGSCPLNPPPAAVRLPRACRSIAADPPRPRAPFARSCAPRGCNRS